nr:DUF4283 domain-containing protein [Erythronium dens-canis]
MEAVRPPTTAKEKAPTKGGSSPAPSASDEEIDAIGEKLAARMIISVEKEAQSTGESHCVGMMEGSRVFERQLGIAYDGSQGEMSYVRNGIGGVISAIKFHRSGWTRDADGYLYTPDLIPAAREVPFPSMAAGNEGEGAGNYVSAPKLLSVSGDEVYPKSLPNLKDTEGITIPPLLDSIPIFKDTEGLKAIQTPVLQCCNTTQLQVPITQLSNPHCRDTERLHTLEFPPLPFKKSTPEPNLHPSSTLQASLIQPVSHKVATMDHTEESTRVEELLNIERSYVIAAKPVSIPSLPEFEFEGSCIKEHTEGLPSIHISSADHEKAKSNFAHTLIMRFTRVRPKLDTIRGIVNGGWGLSKPAAVGVLDSRRLLIRLMNAEDLAVATSKNHGLIDKVPFSLFTWQSNLGRKAESPLCNKWLRLPGLQAELCVRNILSLIGNSFARFIEADPETTNTMKPSHPRICVEIDVSNPLPTKVFIQIGEADGFWQAIAFEGNPAYCSFCRMHGHTTPLCRKRILAEDKHTHRTAAPESQMVWRPKLTPSKVPEHPALEALEQPTRVEVEQPNRAATKEQPTLRSPQQLLHGDAVATSNRFACLDGVTDSSVQENDDLEVIDEDKSREVIEEVGYSLVTKRRKNKSTQSVTIEIPARTRNRSSKEDLAPALDRPEQLFYNSSSKSKQRQAARNIIHGEASDTTADEEEPPDQLISEWEPGAPLL